MSAESIIQFLLNPSLTGSWLILKAGLLGLSLFFIVMILFVLVKTDWLEILMLADFVECLSYKHFSVPAVAKKWKKIKERFKAGTEAEARLIIVEADDFLNVILKKMGFSGNTLGEKLEKLDSEILPNVEQVKKAHGIRSKMVQDPSYHVDMQTAEKVMKVYEEALESLNAL